MTADALIHEKLELLTQLSSKKDYKAFLYDCDGTLADNMHAHKMAYREAAAQYGITLDAAIIDELAGWPTVLIAEEINKRYHTQVPPHEFATAKSTIFLDRYVSDTLPIDFVVHHLQNHIGKVRIGVVSGGSRRTVTRTLTVIGLIDTIETLVCADDTDRGKPYPDPFLKAAQQLGVAPQDCLVFEDGNPGVQGAIAAGMDWIRIDQII
ncbi:HAD family hydrolase [Parapedobacter koreensis]|uniref:Haloacid dehalogenase superfamily, subfamily IA, variant 3 with third motif having DD or ED/haloacid dehalogenase superfamily, subfamily IA, variant 1 with third motif having Dx(3-4)D or Dx(3-4)E n=1 Tax=Parapedobacter koreensis TaxID=332977 RepID=A0A1H7PH47_9SPHI|nr:HAD-IA family hydrolase [Parapedobacter koreensis]SEL34377.1 haloacid dehalogenase superfamily, subfamily IA, variant 3 with third motif having DD or ED/haloacid dehalogenase superfamily, subfamily IA, variant 1 with third motif having Dx(3-4)D or Dx(3-4)E [Parapedobacter koreensis]